MFSCTAGAGLSSSSAFVCVAALALLAAFDAADQSKTVRAATTLHCALAYFYSNRSSSPCFHIGLAFGVAEQSKALWVAAVLLAAFASSLL